MLPFSGILWFPFRRRRFTIGLGSFAFALQMASSSDRAAVVLGDRINFNDHEKYTTWAVHVSDKYMHFAVQAELERRALQQPKRDCHAVDYSSCKTFPDRFELKWKSECNTRAAYAWFMRFVKSCPIPPREGREGWHFGRGKGFG